MSDNKNFDLDRVDFNDISLESLGCHLIFGDVDSDTMKEAVTFILKSNKLMQADELTLFVNTGGGTTNDGFALIDLMDISRLPIKTVSSGHICSMGVLIASAGTKGRRVMTRNTQIMAHQFSWYMEGKYHELQANNKALEHSAHQFIQHFLRHSTMSEAQIKEVMFGPSDRWLTPAECKKYGLIDHIIDALPDLPGTSPAQPPARSREKKSKRPSR